MTSLPCDVKGCCALAKCIAVVTLRGGKKDVIGLCEKHTKQEQPLEIQYLDRIVLVDKREA
jgi:hypothetical protein